MFSLTRKYYLGFVSLLVEIIRITQKQHSNIKQYNHLLRKNVIY